MHTQIRATGTHEHTSSATHAWTRMQQRKLPSNRCVRLISSLRVCTLPSYLAPHPLRERLTHRLMEALGDHICHCVIGYVQTGHSSARKAVPTMEALSPLLIEYLPMGWWMTAVATNCSGRTADAVPPTYGRSISRNRFLHGP